MTAWLELLATVSRGANAKWLNGSTTDGLLIHVSHKYGTGGTDRHVRAAANRLKVAQDRRSRTEGAAAERLLAAAAQRINTSAMLNSPFKSRALRPSSGLIQHPCPRDVYRPFQTLTGGGRTLQMPVFSAMGRILLMKAYGSLNSSQLGSKTGHSGGGWNSSGRGWLIVSR